MSHLVTKNFEVFSAAQFKESLTEPANSIFYMFYGKHTAFPDDNNPPEVTNSQEGTFYDVYDTMIGGKKINDTDVIHMIKRHDWQSGTVYEPYDSQTADLNLKQFFVVVRESSFYNVFKCLDNNYGTASTQAPSKAEVNSDDEIYITEQDGYVWKYMYSIPSTTWDKFATEDYMPVVANTTVANTAVDGAIYSIQVEQVGRDYSSYAEGYIQGTNIGGDEEIISIAGTTGIVFDLTDTSGTFVKEEVVTNYLESIIIADGGTGYSNDDTIVISGGTPVLAAAANLVTNSTGGVVSINIGTRGKGYDNTANVSATISSNTGSSANLVVRLGSANGIVTDIDTANNKLTVSNIRGRINQLDSIEGLTSGATANITGVTYVGDSLSSNTDFYKGSIIYIDHGTGAGQFKQIQEYAVTANEKRIIVNGAFTTPLSTDSHYIIGPKVTITGDGSGAVALAKVNSTLNINAIANIQMLSVGSGYTYADILITGNTGFVTNASTNSYITQSATARAVYSPKGGHGSDVLNELFANRIGISVTLANTEGATLSVENDYRQIGLLKDPKFTEGTLAIDAITTPITATSIITGANSGATARVDSIDSSSIVVSNIVGFFTSGENVTTTAGGNVTISTVTQPTTTFRQTYKYTGSITAGPGIQEDEIVSQAGIPNTVATVLTGLTSGNGTIEVTNQRGNFELSEGTVGSAGFLEKTFRGTTSETTFRLLASSEPQVVDGSGEVLYIENFSPVTRNANQSETFRLIIEF